MDTELLIDIMTKFRNSAAEKASECWKLAGTNINSHFVAEARYQQGRVSALDEALAIASALKGVANAKG